MLIMWDNRSVMHMAEGGYDGYERLMHRITIAGETQLNQFKLYKKKGR